MSHIRHPNTSCCVPPASLHRRLPRWEASSARLTAKILAHHETLADPQTLASIASVVGSGSVDGGCANGLSQGDGDTAPHDRYMDCYAERCFQWGAEGERAETVGHLKAHKLPHEMAKPIAKHGELECVLCNTPTHGRRLRCHRCGHGGHAKHVAVSFQNEPTAKFRQGVEQFLFGTSVCSFARKRIMRTIGKLEAEYKQVYFVTTPETFFIRLQQIVGATHTLRMHCTALQNTAETGERGPNPRLREREKPERGRDYNGLFVNGLVQLLPLVTCCRGVGHSHLEMETVTSLMK